MHHVVERSLRPFEGHGGFAPWWYLFYLAAVPITFLPSSAFLLRLFGRHEGEDPIPRHRALWIWVLGTLLVFTLATSKLPHYPMPAFPALAILAAAACSPRHVHRADRWIAGLFIVLGLAFAGLMIAALPATDQVLEWRGENPPGVSSGVVPERACLRRDDVCRSAALLVWAARAEPPDGESRQPLRLCLTRERRVREAQPSPRRASAA
jgi:peptidoglycan/LPS O-acetylase OafA/YrhL